MMAHLLHQGLCTFQFDTACYLYYLYLHAPVLFSYHSTHMLHCLISDKLIPA